MTANDLKYRRTKNVRGFTLIELMTVSAIIAILAAMTFANLGRMRIQANETNAMQALNTVATAYEMYYFYNKAYPQWGPGQRFANPEDLWMHLVDEDFLPSGFKHVTYNPNSQYLFGFTQDYAVDIPQFNDADPTIEEHSSYFVVLRPYNFQRDALAVGLNPPTGWVAVRARRGLDTANYRTYHLYTFSKGGAVD